MGNVNVVIGAGSIGQAITRVRRIGPEIRNPGLTP